MEYSYVCTEIEGLFDVPEGHGPPKPKRLTYIHTSALGPFQYPPGNSKPG